MAALPTTIFYLIDDTNTAAGTGAGSGAQVFPDFVATSVANATTVATLVATILQRSVRLVNKYGTQPPWTAVLPSPVNIANTAVPSGTFAA